MSSLLESFLQTMKNEHQVELKKLLKQEDVAIGEVDRHILERQLNRLISKIGEESEFSFNPTMQQGRIKSKPYNKNMNEIETDLRIIFYVSSMVDQYMSSHFRLTASEMQEMRKNISDIKKKLNRFKLLSGKNIPFSDYTYENFEFPEKTETDMGTLEILGKGKDGEEFNPNNVAEVRGQKLVLSSYETTDQLKTGYGRALAEIEVSRRNGHANVIEGHDIRKAFDTSDETYWAENLIVDTPISGHNNEDWVRNASTDNLQGAIVELEISLHNIATVSELHYNPFGFYPIEVVSVTGYENTDFGGITYKLIHPEHENPSQVNRSSIEPMVFKFPSVDIGSLRILIRQETHSRENFIVNANERNENELWMNLSSAPKSIPDTTSSNENIEEFNEKLEKSGWISYLDNLTRWARENNQKHIEQSAMRAMEAVKGGDFNSGALLQLKAENGLEVPEGLDNEFKAISKTSYVYGAKNISLYGRKYRESSVYISKRQDLSINLKKIMLETKEEHEYKINQRTGERVRITDIEYYITGKKNALPSEWHPILPIGKEIEGERLTGDSILGTYPELGNGIQYSLRFKTVSKGSVIIYRDGMPLPVEHYRVSDDLKKVSILKQYYVPTSIYTVKYRPDESAYVYDISKSSNYTPSQYVDENGQNGEVFHDVETGSHIKLKNTPLISRESVLKDEDRKYGYYQDDDFINSGGIDYPIHVWADGVKLLNITKYDSSTYDPSDLESNDGYTFAQVGKKIILGVPKGKVRYERVSVDYRFVMTDIKLKAILRRNTLDTESVTPSLLEYSLKAETNDIESREGGVYVD